MYLEYSYHCAQLNFSLGRRQRGVKRGDGDAGGGEKLGPESERRGRRTWRGGRTVRASWSPRSELTRQDGPAGPRPGPGDRSPGRALQVLSSVEAPAPSAIHALCTLATRKGVSPTPRSIGGGTGSSTRGFLESPAAFPRDPGPHWLVESRASSSLCSGFPRTHPVPTPESWRPARDARRPGGRPAKFRVPLQETGSCVPGSGKPAVWARDSLAKPPKAPGTPLQVEFLLCITSILINLLKHRCHVACRKLIKPESLLHSKNFDPSPLKRT